MKSKWFELKPESIRLRKLGKSLPFIHTSLGIPKSTLSHWFRDIKLSHKHTKRLHENWKEGLIKARIEAVKWHNQEKSNRLKTAENESFQILEQIDTKDTNIIELALALLYLGEGTKAQSETGMGSSDPLILKFFIACLRNIYKVPESKIKCHLQLRADQDPKEMLTYWSKELKISESNFNKTHLDTRTLGIKTYSSYKGVCVIRCGQVAIQRKLVYIAKHFCDDVSKTVN